jgi:hypothetical protein
VTAPHASVFAVVFVALFVGHQVGDHWVQTSHQSRTKAHPGWTGRLADARHVASLTATKALLLAVTAAVLDLPLTWPALVLGFTVDAASHWWADRRTTLAHLANSLGLSRFYTLGAPRTGHDDNPILGTGAYALNQSFHHLWLLVTALLITAA